MNLKVLMKKLWQVKLTKTTDNQGRNKKSKYRKQQADTRIAELKEVLFAQVWLKPVYVQLYRLQFVWTWWGGQEENNRKENNLF